MTPLVFECPRTRRAIDAGVQMDRNTLIAASHATLKLPCSYCGISHEFPVERGRLAESVCLSEALVEPQPPKLPALTIAINALRIWWLRRGLADGRTHISKQEAPLQV